MSVPRGKMFHNPTADSVQDKSFRKVVKCSYALSVGI